MIWGLHIFCNRKYNDIEIKKEGKRRVNIKVDEEMVI